MRKIPECFDSADRSAVAADILVREAPDEEEEDDYDEDEEGEDDIEDDDEEGYSK